MKMLACLAALMLVPVPVACSHAQTGTVTGQTWIEGGPAPGVHRPLAHQRFTVLSGAHVVGRLRTDAHGRFSFSLPAGSYRLATTAFLSPHTVTVSAGRTTHLRLTLDAL